MPTLVELFGLSLYTAKIPVRSSAHYWRRFMLFRMEHRQAILSAHQWAKLQHIAINGRPAAFKTLSVVLISSDPSDRHNDGPKTGTSLTS